MCLARASTRPRPPPACRLPLDPRTTPRTPRAQPSHPRPLSPLSRKNTSSTERARRRRSPYPWPPATPCPKSQPKSSASPRCFASPTEGTPGGRQHRQDRRLRCLLLHLAVVDSRAPVRPRANRPTQLTRGEPLSVSPLPFCSLPCCSAVPRHDRSRRPPWPLFLQRSCFSARTRAPRMLLEQLGGQRHP